MFSKKVVSLLQYYNLFCFLGLVPKRSREMATQHDATRIKQRPWAYQRLHCPRARPTAQRWARLHAALRTYADHRGYEGPHSSSPPDELQRAVLTKHVAVLSRKEARHTITWKARVLVINLTLKRRWMFQTEMTLA